MGAFDQENYEIRSRLPEWWKSDLFLEVVNNYSVQVVTDMLQEFLPYLGVLQPWQVWKTLPEEENWEHTYGHPTNGAVTDKWLDGRLKLDNGESFTAYVPNTKRNCDAILKINLKSIDSDASFHKQKISKLVLTNANQTITIRDLDIDSTIEINTETGIVLINGFEDNSRVLENGIYYNKVHGSFMNIKSEPLDPERMGDLSPNEENKVTKINVQAFPVTSQTRIKVDDVTGEKTEEEFLSKGSCRIDFSIKLLHPVYVIEQNIRVWSPSAFPLKSIKLYGYFCHEHNYNEGWMYLYERGYSLEDRVVYDRITKEYDCEIFYAVFEYYGIPVPVTIGFPQEEHHENPAFETNKALDYWGKILNLKRRYYNDNISEKDERKTFPQYYTYSIEQDYWYEQRMIHEYRANDNLNHGAFLTDTDGNNLAHVNVIDPYAKDIYIYSETIPSMQSNNSHLDGNLLYRTIFSHENNQQPWLNYTNIGPEDNYSEINLNAYTTSAISDESYMSDILSLYFQIPEDIPKNIKITGMEVDIEGFNNVYMNNVTLTDNSAIYLPKKYQSSIHITDTNQYKGYLFEGVFYKNKVEREYETDIKYEDLIPSNDNYMYVNLNEESDNRYVWNSVKKKYVKFLITVDGNKWIWSINRKEHVPLEYTRTNGTTEEYYTYNQIIDKYQKGTPDEIPEKERIYFIAYNKIIKGFGLKEDINYNEDEYTDTEITYDEFYRVKADSQIKTEIFYEQIYENKTGVIYYNYLDGQKYIWDEDKNKYTEIYQIQNNTEYSQINLSYGVWPTNNRLLKIGGEDDLLFYKDDITKMQLDQGYILPTNNGDEFKPRTIRVDLQFKNDSEERKANLKIKNVQLKFWYKIVFEEYTVDMDVKPTLERHRAKCTKVTDADTIWIEGVDKSIRLAGINAYETTTEIGQTAKEYVKDKCLNKPVTAYIELSNPDIYCRYSGVVYAKINENKEEINLNQHVLDMGYGVSSFEKWPRRDYPSIESIEKDKRFRINIHVKNTGIIPIIYKDLFLILPPEALYKRPNEAYWHPTIPAPVTRGYYQDGEFIAFESYEGSECASDTNDTNAEILYDRYANKFYKNDEEINLLTNFAPLRLPLKDALDADGNPVTEDTVDFYLQYDILFQDGQQGLYDIIVFYDGKEIKKEIAFKFDLNKIETC